MMIDLKPEIKQALRSNPDLGSRLGKDKDGNVRVYPECSPDNALPYVTFFELVNYDNKYVDNMPISSDIHFQVDIWTNGNTGPIAAAVNTTMESMDFVRSGSIDQFEPDTQTYHKVLRYKKIQFGS